MQTSRSLGNRHRSYVAALAVAAGTVALALPSLGQATERDPAAKRFETVTVMSQNVYLGADLTPLFNTTDTDDLKEKAADVLEEVQRTDFPSRAERLAANIAAAKPDLVGLQEAVQYRFDLEDPNTPGEDAGSGPLDGPAETNFQNFTNILRAKLRAIGMRYKIVAIDDGVPDIELPVRDRSPNAPDDDFDARGTFHDTILARRGSGVKTHDSQFAQFFNNLELEAGGFPIIVRRGWDMVEANVRGAKFRFVNTHLEAFGDPKVRRDQAKELVQEGGPAYSPSANGQPRRRIVLLGDFNTGDKETDNIGVTAGTAQDRLAYGVIERAGFLERQTQAFTCCYPSSMNDPNDVFDHTVDHIFVNTPKIKLVRSFVTGDDPAEMTPSGLWPSDHGGLVSVLKIPTCSPLDPRC